MKSLFGLVALTFLNVLTPHANDASQPNDLKIAQVVRKAVRDADSTLLHTTVLGNWRDYLKIAAIDLEIELQPLVLIKFDEDMSFRTQLKKAHRVGSNLPESRNGALHLLSQVGCPAAGTDSGRSGSPFQRSDQAVQHRTARKDPLPLRRVAGRRRGLCIRRFARRHCFAPAV